MGSVDNFLRIPDLSALGCSFCPLRQCEPRVQFQFVTRVITLERQPHSSPSSTLSRLSTLSNPSTPSSPSLNASLLGVGHALVRKGATNFAHSTRLVKGREFRSQIDKWLKALYKCRDGSSMARVHYLFIQIFSWDLIFVANSFRMLSPRIERHTWNDRQSKCSHLRSRRWRTACRSVCTSYRF